MIEYWYALVICCIIGGVVGYNIYNFIKKPTNAQIREVKEWLLYAVTLAESELGGKTGEVKLRYVYDLFISRFPVISNVMSFEMFDRMVDGALDELQRILKTNDETKSKIEQSQIPKNN